MTPRRIVFLSQLNHGAHHAAAGFALKESYAQQPHADAGTLALRQGL